MRAESSPKITVRFDRLRVMEHLGKPGSPFRRGRALELALSDLGSWDAVWMRWKGRVRPTWQAVVFCSKGRRDLCALGRRQARGVCVHDETGSGRDRRRGAGGRSLACAGHQGTRVAHPSWKRSPEADTHRKVRRPWVSTIPSIHGERFQVKRIVVTPGARCRCKCITTARSTGRL